MAQGGQLNNVLQSDGGKFYVAGVEISLGGGSASASYVWSAGATVANITTTKTLISTAIGARSVRVQYGKVSGTPTGTGLRVVFNAINDTDANTKLTTAGQYFTVPLGDSRQFDFASGSEVLRIDIASDAAIEAGVTTSLVEYGV